MADDLKAHCNRRLFSMKAQRQPYEVDWKEIAGYCAPARSRFLSTSANKGRRSNRRLNNGYGILSFRTLQNGMTAGLSSKSRPWFKVSLYDQNLLDDPQVKAWLDDVQNVVEAALAATNFYEAVEVGYLELGMFGTEAGVIIKERGEIICHALTAGEYWVGLNSKMKPGALYRDSGMSVLQTVETFGLDKVSDRVKSLHKNSEYETIVPIFHCIEENPDYEEGKLGPKGKAWRSLHFEGWDGTIGCLLKEDGYEEQPFWAPRWSTTGADTYGQGPGHDALPDLRELQLQSKRKAEITDLMAWPEIVSSSKIKLKRQPKSVVSTDVVDAAKMVNVPYQVPPQALAAVEQDVNRLEQRVGQISFADLFMAITSGMPGVQPRNQDEINARLDEKMTQLGPVIERVNGEKLTVALDRFVGLLQRDGRFPPAPEALRNSPHIKYEFISILTQMQRMAGLSQIERVTQFVGGLAGMYPQARFKLDPMAIVDEYGERAGVPAKAMRSTEDAMKDVQAEQQQQQQAQAAQMMKTVGKPTKDLTDAATLAANLPVAKTSALAGLEQPQP